MDKRKLKLSGKAKLKYQLSRSQKAKEYEKLEKLLDMLEAQIQHKRTEYANLTSIYIQAKFNDMKDIIAIIRKELKDDKHRYVNLASKSKLKLPKRTSLTERRLHPLEAMFNEFMRQTSYDTEIPY